MPRKGENIYHRKDGRWEGRYAVAKDSTGKIKYVYVYGKTYKDVKEKLFQKKVDFKKKSDQSCPHEDMLFSAIADEWLSSKKSQIKISSYVKYKNLLENYIQPQFKKKHVAEIDIDFLEMFCLELTERGGKKGLGLSSKTITDILSVIRSIMQYAGRKKLNPICDGTGITVIKKENKRPVTLSQQEQNVLCKYLQENPTSINLGILFSLFTGLRIGEICALKWSDISFAENTVYVSQTMQRIQIDGHSEKKTEIIITSPKSSCSIRKIPLPDDLIKLINQYPPQSGFFLTCKEQLFIEPRSLNNHFKKILTTCNLPNINYHVLRHTFATRCIEVGFDIKSLSEILGHASVTITMNRYVHPSMNLKKDNMNRLNSLLTVK